MADYESKDGESFIKAYTEQDVTDEEQAYQITEKETRNRYCGDCMQVRKHQYIHLANGSCWMICLRCGDMRKDIGLDDNSGLPYTREPKSGVRDLTKLEVEQAAAFKYTEAAQYFTWDEWADMGYEYPEGFDIRRANKVYSNEVSSAMSEKHDKAPQTPAWCTSCRDKTIHNYTRYPSFNHYECSVCGAGYTIQTVSKRERMRRCRSKKSRK